jgi:hypothetical protein
VLVVGGIVLARGQDEPDAGVAVALLAVVYAGVAGLLLAPGDLGTWQWPLPAEFFEARSPPLVPRCSRSAWSPWSGLRQGGPRHPLPSWWERSSLPPGMLIRVFDVDPDRRVHGPDGAGGARWQRSFPWLALGRHRDPGRPDLLLHDITADPDEIDPAQVGADARVAHEILLAVSATVGTLLVLLVPMAVSRGVYGTILAAVCCLAVMFRTRQYRAGSEVLAGLLSGILGLVSLALSMLLIHDEWRAEAAVALAVVGAVLLVSTLVPASPSVRRGRIGDAVETATLLSLLPLMVMAAGFFDMVKG